jgi:chromosome segregation ATPase
MNERLQEIKNKLEKARGKRGMQDAIYAEYGDWLLSQAEKVEQLQQKIEHLNLKYNASLDAIVGFVQDIERLKEQLQQAQAKAERYEKALQEIVKYTGSDYTMVPYAIATKALEGSS